MRATPFAKYHGIGNDFVVVDSEDPAEWTPARVTAVCDRHFGVGADGVLLVSAASDSGAVARMRVLNADGSRPEMCGNGLRCVALHLASTRPELPSTFDVATDAGVLQCDVVRDGRGAMVRTSIGSARILGEHVAGGGSSGPRFVRVSTGNPHLVTFGEPVTAERAAELGPALNEQIDGGVNVELAERLADDHLRLVVWERGAGLTLACGTGAAATVAAAIARGLCDFDREVRVSLPGGELHITIASAGGRAVIRGPAELVFRGELVEP